jgi:phospholipid-transporting ATPase
MFSGQTMYDKVIYQLYNFLYTSLPIVYFGVYDKEHEPEVLLNSDKHYLQGIIGKLFHAKRFWKWVLMGFFQGLIIVIFHVFSFTTNNSNGYSQNLWSFGSMFYSSVVLIVNLRLLFSTNNIDIWSFSLIFISIFLYYLTLLIMNFSSFWDNFNNFTMIMSAFNFYLSSILICVLAYIMDNGCGNLLRLFGCIKNPLEIQKIEINSYTNIPVCAKENYIDNDYNKKNGKDFEFTDSYKKIILKEI